MARHKTTTTTTPTADNDAGDDPDEPGSSTGEAHQRNQTNRASVGATPQPVSLSCRDRNLSTADARWLREHLTRAIDTIGCAIQRLDVVIVDDDEMRRMNRDFHHVDDTTDVLSFQQSGPDEPIETDIAICYDTAVREAERRGHVVRHELLLYALHGLLHCCGYDDSTDADREVMHTEEDRILEAIGVGRVYGTNSGSNAPARRDDGPPSGGNSHP